MTRHNTTTAEVDDVGNGDYFANHLRNTASSHYNNSQNNNRHGYQHNYYHDDGVNDDDNNTEQSTTDTMIRSSRNSSGTRVSLEDNYSRAMNRMKRGGDFNPNYDRQSFREEENENRTTASTSRSSGSGNGKNGGRISSSSNSNSSAPLSSRLSGSSGNRDNQNRTTSRRGSEESAAGSKKSNLCTNSRLSRGSNNSANNTALTVIKKMVEKRTISDKDPSEETIAIFGAYGVTGNHFLKFAMEAGYKVQALILPGMEMNDVACNDNLQLVTGSFDEDEKIRKVVEDATYVVCLLNDCDRSLHHQDQENLPPPIGNTDGSDVDNSISLNLNFMHNLVPILEESDTCRVLLYQASSVALDNKGSTPIITKMVKKLAVRKNWREMKREQDRIVKYVVNQTKDAAFNYIITRPSDSMIRDKPSRKKLAASKSQPGLFPVTNIDLAEFTLCALRMKKVYNSCPYVVQDGI